MTSSSCGVSGAASSATLSASSSAATDDAEPRAAAHRLGSEAVVEGVGILDRLSIDGDDQVAGFEPRARRRARRCRRFAISAPEGRLSPRPSAISGVTACSRAPSQGRFTVEPPLLAEATTTFAIFAGMAKPIPCEPPEREKIAVLMPTRTSAGRPARRPNCQD